MGQGMTNTYAINTTKNREFEVAEELKTIGLHPWVPKMLASRYVKEKREVVWWDRAYIPKLMFCVIPAIYWRDVVEIKHVIGKPLRLSRLDIDGMPAMNGRPPRYGLRDFQQVVHAEYLDAQARRESYENADARRKANTEFQCHYKPGQALEILDAAFQGMPATFRAMVRHAHDDFAKLRVEIEIFGAPREVEVDPDKVKATG